jgi:hypothetical protein
MPVSKPVSIYHTRFQDLERVAALKPGWAQLFLTDPPYNGAWLPQWGELGAFAARLLAEGGLLVTYTGKMYLPQVMAALGRHLTYRWTLDSIREQGSSTNSLQVMGCWMPVLVYSKGPWVPREPWRDVLRAPKEKTLHPWQQPIQEAERLVSNFSNPGDLVIDPCGGSFTVAEACLRLGRDCISCDSELGCVSVGKTRLREARESLRHTG